MATVEPMPAAETLALPLPLYTSIYVGALMSRDGDMLSVYAGLDEKMVAQLKEHSLDESDTEVQNNTSDRQRFGEGSYEKWYAKERTPFALIDNATGALAAITWFGPKPLGRKSMKHLSAEERAVDERTFNTDNWHTIVYRAYHPFRGKGIMIPFTKFTMDLYQKKYPDSKIWAGIYADNPASVGFATKLGFETLPGASGPKEMVMVLKNG